MSDPFLSGAEAAINSLKKGLELGKKAEDLSADIGKFINSAAEIKYAHARAQSKKFASTDEDAIRLFIQKKKIEKMEDEFRELVCRQYGPNAWNEIQKIQAEIKKKKQEDLDQLKRDKLKSKFLALFAFCILPFSIFICYLIFKYR